MTVRPARPYRLLRFFASSKLITPGMRPSLSGSDVQVSSVAAHRAMKLRRHPQRRCCERPAGQRAGGRLTPRKKCPSFLDISKSIDFKIQDSPAVGPQLSWMTRESRAVGRHLELRVFQSFQRRGGSVEISDTTGWHPWARAPGRDRSCRNLRRRTAPRYGVSLSTRLISP
jgi:hypothetical protein